MPIDRIRARKPKTGDSAPLDSSDSPMDKCSVVGACWLARSPATPPWRGDAVRLLGSGWLRSARGSAYRPLVPWPQTETPASKNTRTAIMVRVFCLVRGGGQGRGRTADLPLFRRTLVPTELPDLGWAPGPDGPRRRPALAVLTGFEPATSTLTGWRAPRAALQDHAALAGCQQCPQRDLNPCRRLERAVS